MCGIFGCVGRMSREMASECIKKISYRGPDACVVKELDGAIFAHTRLSIIDIAEQANQPMSDVTGRYWIVYNGEIYNYIEIKKELKERGHQFITNCDTEVVLHAYIEWGEECQEKCNGMWAMAIWDNLEKKLFLSRDRFGIKPLYIYETPSGFYFASEMKAFFPILKEKRINYDIFDKKKYFSYEATENCCIKGIKKISAGHHGYYMGNRLSVKRWWCTLDHLIDVPADYGQQIEQFREIFLDACRIRMRSDVPIGTALSGGIDSSAVVGAMRHISQQDDKNMNRDWQHTFVASMPDTSIDETEYAEMASKYVDIDIQKVPITANVSYDEIMRYLYICEDPCITLPLPIFQTYQYISNLGIRVTLDGHGADELFGGYPVDILIAAGTNRHDEKMLEEIWQTYNGTQLLERRVDLKEFSRRVDQSVVGRSVDEKHGNWKQLDEFNRRLYIQTHEHTLPTLLRCYDRYSMGNGLEIRMPFMDYRIVCFAFSVPWTSKIRNGYTKAIVRDMAKPYMEARILYRKLKIGFNAPVTEWFQGDLKEFLLDTIHSKDFYECELINPLDVTIKVNEFLYNNHGYYHEGEAVWKEIFPYLWKKAVISDRIYE